MSDPIQDALQVEDLPDVGAIGFVAEIWESLNRAVGLPSHNACGAAIRIAALSVRLATAIRHEQGQATELDEAWVALAEEVASEKTRRSSGGLTASDSWNAWRPDLERLLQQILRSLDQLYVQELAIPDAATCGIMVGAAAILIAEDYDLSQ
jgi:hypothetical protein